MTEIKTNKAEQYSDASYLFALIFHYKIPILIIIALAALTSSIIAFTLPVWYSSTVNCVPPTESTSAGNTSGLSSIMKDIGISKIGGSKSQEYTMVVFLESRTVIDSIIKKYELAKEYNISDTLVSQVRKEFLENRSIDYTDEGNYEITIWDKDKQRAADIANEYINITNHIANKTFQEELGVNISYLEKRIKSIDSAITATSIQLAKISKESLIFSPEYQGQAASKALADIKSAALQYEIFYDFYSKNYGKNDPATIMTKEMLEAANEKLSDAYNKPGFIGNFSLKEAAPIAVDYFTKYADIEALTKVKAILVTSLEKNLIDRSKYINNFFVVDKAIPADKKDRPKRLFIVAGSIVGAFVLCVFLLLIINSFKLAIANTKKIQ